MPTYSPRLIIAIPAADIESARKLGTLFDPDAGGADTWALDRQAGGYLWTETPVYAELESLVRARDSATWFAFLGQLAEQKGIEPFTMEEIEHLCSSILIDDEFAPVAEPAE